MTLKELEAKFREDPFEGLSGDKVFWLTTKLSELSGKEKDEFLEKFSEERAREHIARWLRIIADHIESKDYPFIMECNIPARSPDLPGYNKLTEDFSIIFSQPWPG
jgi:hypothetical protein